MSGGIFYTNVLSDTQLLFMIYFWFSKTLNTILLNKIIGENTSLTFETIEFQHRQQ